MDRDVRAAVEQRLLDFLDEQALAADLIEGAILDPVTGRSHVEFAGLYAGGRGELGHPSARLGQCEGALARGHGYESTTHGRLRSTSFRRSLVFDAWREATSSQPRNRTHQSRRRTRAARCVELTSPTPI